MLRLREKEFENLVEDVYQEGKQEGYESGFEAGFEFAMEKLNVPDEENPITQKGFTKKRFEKYN